MTNKIFEKNLEKEGLQLEHEQAEPNGLHFIKIHATKEVLRRYAEILKLRLPMKELLKCEIPQTYNNVIIKEVNTFVRRIMSKYYVDTTVFPTMKHHFTAVYSRDKEYLFDLDSPNFFSSATRSRIVQFILDRTKFTETKEDDFAFGIERLITERAYVAAYSLHDGNLHTPDSMRYLLYTEWASLKKCLHYQPLDYIKEYFGVKIGLYFAWLGFYTHMLIPASIVGLLCFIYSCATLYSNEPSEDICNGNGIIEMCPLCDHFCGYWDLKETCLHARITYLFDNPSTVFFSIFMSLWATLFLELWKKYSAEITHRWDLTGLDVHEEYPRPQYLARLAHIKKKSINIITNVEEPKVPYWKMRLPATILSFSVVLLLIAVAMAAVLGVVLYRMSVLTALSVYGHPMVTSYAILFTTATAATINLCCIIFFNWIYVWLAEYLTEIELLRTQTEFDDSLTLKIYLLEFVNYYASIFYIAFFKGKFVGYPGKYNRFFGFRQEECGPGGCLLELCIQLSIIMVGKQAMNTILEMLYPLFYKWMNTLKVHMGSKKPKDNDKRYSSRKFLQWIRDYKLVQWGPRSLFPEYLEMVLQYGFVTIFVAAFPLAPFFALLNNVFEMRLDAKKLLTMYRRPVGQRVRDIGIWYRILDSISKLSVITNAFIIAFTSNFIPRLVYRLTISDNYSLEGFLEHSLSKFNTSDLKNGTQPIPSLGQHSVDVCRYPGYREPPDSTNKYEYTIMFWHVLAARLAFIVVFENVVALVIIFVRWCIPDISPKLRDKIRREAYITNEIIIHQEALRAHTRPTINESTMEQTYMVSNESSNRWNRVMRNSLSTSEFDLEVHGSPVSPVNTEPRISPAAV
ncbi:anoctamin-1 isoform X2 [Harpegnathos saltator]|uniref:anoctamin-1 isoform X2 n=1 Tax=Harpegnathos saltator TaxID=610380 RepID=UPI00058C1C1F|nr:anoctamin-1 isoform X2 [Harpegnathos saltator]XP_019698196.1 anoctamin-1 isoform X2 [Harpegnathos saltator]XP_025152640.1 anoctamin-1 isoform X2 [Harpegnathos saltator]XP_025152641.1 anoctamin-1 isoform X2 [Harpegnathos saltator]XP_025152642.1 anoctamin-1 isoform X2 [Harpegnathos saltator]XP_025152643.1 anoctamin-1 isoform X2 [Harpegnathos saltator]